MGCTPRTRCGAFKKIKLLMHAGKKNLRRLPKRFSPNSDMKESLGIDAETTYFPRLPRPTKIAEGQVIDGLFA